MPLSCVVYPSNFIATRRGSSARSNALNRSMIAKVCRNGNCCIPCTSVWLLYAYINFTPFINCRQGRKTECFALGDKLPEALRMQINQATRLKTRPEQDDDEKKPSMDKPPKAPSSPRPRSNSLRLQRCCTEPNPTPPLKPPVNLKDSKIYQSYVQDRFELCAEKSTQPAVILQVDCQRAFPCLVSRVRMMR